MIFGSENVDQRPAQVDREKVIFSWLTNATLAASIKGHVVLLDTFVHRAEIVPGRTLFVAAAETCNELRGDAVRFVGRKRQGGENDD